MYLNSIAGDAEMLVKLFLNGKNGAGSFAPDDELRCVWKGDMAGETDAKILSNTFEIFNVNHPDDYQERSLSIGDVIAILEDNKIPRCYAVEPSGFSSVALTPFVLGQKVTTAGDQGDEEIDTMWGADETPDYPMYEG
jgi:hypothetical protein